MITFSDFLAASIDEPGLVGRAARILADAGRLDTPEHALAYLAHADRVDPHTLAAVEAAERAFFAAR